MQTLTMTRLNQQTAAVLDAVSRGETFKIIRHRKAIGYLTPEPPIPKARRQAATDWDEHFNWVRAQGKFSADDLGRTPETAR